MAELERELRRAAAEVEFPPTPPLAPTVAQRLRDEAARSRRRRGGGWRPRTARVALLAIALVLIISGGVVAAVPAARHAVLDLVGLRGATIERVPSLSRDVGVWPGLGLAKASTLESARRSLSFRPLLPTRLGEPNGVFLAVDEAPPGGELLLTYAPRPGMPRSRYTGVGVLLDEINGNFAPGFFYKLAPRGVRIERLRVAGNYAIWIEGLHEFFYKDAEIHTFRRGRTRLAGNTLLVQRGPVMVRIEGKFGLRKAAAIARSLRPVGD